MDPAEEPEKANPPPPTNPTHTRTRVKAEAREASHRTRREAALQQTRGAALARAQPNPRVSRYKTPSRGAAALVVTTLAPRLGPRPSPQLPTHPGEENAGSNTATAHGGRLHPGLPALTSRPTGTTAPHGVHQDPQQRLKTAGAPCSMATASAKPDRDGAQSFRPPWARNQPTDTENTILTPHSSSPTLCNTT
ncbi:hypothetical protein GQ55_1G057200 [Panicum hallii var. hallii]|uniref:Uncharacterized protein n=1 Tax=Panicum hallii var. hallii TaxID=1504633 RepID=A0A2T7F2N5_9POAL|nr:hypothetical protein GQ55_1G057200 [Panicum hallii var. hallii]